MSRTYTFRADTFNGLTQQLDRFIDEDDRYMKVESIVAKRVDVNTRAPHTDYYWEAVLTFNTTYVAKSTINTDDMHHAV